MRWINKKLPEHKETRIYRLFLFLPMTIENETRWLEFAWVGQTYYRRTRKCGWVNREFLG